MISIAMFNNKGGVGKTTLTCNLASFIAGLGKHRVLVIDCDPQCNSTQLIMGIERAAALYMGASGADTISTIKDVLQPIQDGDSGINTDLQFLQAKDNRFNVDLLPGHPEFAIIEDRLGIAWGQLKARETSGYRQTNWNTLLCKFLSDSYDIVFFDLGPSLGSINRSVLVGCQYFITPLGSDVFSIIGVKNIAQWLDSWLSDYKHSWNGIQTQAQKDELAQKFGVTSAPAIIDGYIGYTVQQYITKSYGKERRATKAYESIISDVDKEIESALNNYFSASLKANNAAAKLGDIPHLYSLVPLAQKKAVPIHGLRSDDGLVGSQFSAVREYRTMIEPIAEHLLANVGEQE